SVRERDRDAEARLERRLVEAREDAPRVGRLALGEGIAAAVGLRGIEAAEMLVERGGKAQPEDHLAGRERASEAEGHGLVGAPQARARLDLPSTDLGRRGLDLQVGGMERERGPPPIEADGDPDLAREAAGVEVGLEVEVVLRRADVDGQTEA